MRVKWVSDATALLYIAVGLVLFVVIARLLDGERWASLFPLLSYDFLFIRTTARTLSMKVLCKWHHHLGPPIPWQPYIKCACVRIMLLTTWSSFTDFTHSQWFDSRTARHMRHSHKSHFQMLFRNFMLCNQDCLFVFPKRKWI